MHQTKLLQQHGIQHKTACTDQRENHRKANSADKLAINDKRQQHTPTSSSNNKLTKTFYNQPVRKPATNRYTEQKTE